MTMAAHYPYASGELLDQPQSYQYSPFQGNEFIAAWAHNRAEALADLPPAVTPVRPDAPLATLIVDTMGDGCETLPQLDALLAAVCAGSFNQDQGYALLAPWVKRFEISKRLHTAYGPRLRPRTPEAFRQLAPYLRFAELLEAAWTQWPEWPYFNALLKTLDVLVAHRAELTDAQGATLAWLLGRERAHLEALMNDQGLRP